MSDVKINELLLNRESLCLNNCNIEKNMLINSKHVKFSTLEDVKPKFNNISNGQAILKQDYCLQNSFKSPKKIITIKNRDKIYLRNKKLEAESKLASPQVNYIVNSCFKLPKISDSKTKIKDEVNKIVMKKIPLLEKELEHHYIYDNNLKNENKLNKKSNDMNKNLNIKKINNKGEFKLSFEEKNNLKCEIKQLKENINCSSKQIINKIYKKIENNYFNNHKEYTNLKKIESLNKSYKLIEKYNEYDKNTKLWVAINNPILQFNEKIAIPCILSDSVVLGFIHLQNSIKLDTTSSKYLIDD